MGFELFGLMSQYEIPTINMQHIIVTSEKNGGYVKSKFNII